MANSTASSTRYTPVLSEVVKLLIVILTYGISYTAIPSILVVYIISITITIINLAD